MGRVFVDVSMSLDGFIAGPNGGPGNPIGDGGPRLHHWMYPTAAFRERLSLAGGERGPDHDQIAATFARAGAYVLGRGMFDEGETAWPENAPYRAPVFVLTSRGREPWPRPGGTVFHFVTDGIESALKQARKAAGDLDVRIAGGASVIQQYVKAGQVDELRIHLAPVLLGAGVRLFDRLGAKDLKLERLSVTDSPAATHVAYRVVK